MIIPKINNIKIDRITDDILLIHQIKASSRFTRCDGLLILPKEGRNSKTIVLDVNVEPKYIKSINRIYGPVSEYVCSHGHMDHIAHVYVWEKLGANIHGFIPETNYLLNLHNFFEGFGFNDAMDFSIIEKFAKMNEYHECNNVNPIKPGSKLKFENFTFETIPFQGHSLANVGFYLPEERILHIGCLGFDLSEPNSEGFGPWYGFKQCSIPQYLKDIDFAEALYLEKANFLTSSHGYIVKNPDKYPFNYMRKKIENNQLKINQALKSLNLSIKSKDKAIKNLLKMDLFFPKRKISNFMLKIYTLWEYWIIQKHVQRSNLFKN